MRLHLRSFTDQARRAGLTGLPCAWGEDGQISGRENLTLEQNAALDALMAAHSPLEGIKADLCARVDADAERERVGSGTLGAGMAMTYTEKFAQAQGVAAMGEAAANAMPPETYLEQFPTLAASVGIEAPTLWGCAQIVLAKYAEFAKLSYTIERARQMGKKAILEAPDASAAEAAYGAIKWTT